MSRTTKGKKPIGYDYWGKRPYSGKGFGPAIKHLTHKAERAQAKQSLLHEPLEPEYDDREWVPDDFRADDGGTVPGVSSE